MQSLKGFKSHRLVALTCLLAIEQITFGSEAVQMQAVVAENNGSEALIRPDDEVKVILVKAIKAQGNPLPWKKGYVKYKTKSDMFPDMDAEAITEDTFDLPGHFKRQVRIKTPRDEVKMVFVINNGKGWKRIGGAEPQPIEDNFTKNAEHVFAALCDFPRKVDEKTRLTKAGEEKVGDYSTVVIRVESEKLGQMDWYFNKQNALVVKSKKTLLGEGPDKRGFVETFFDDYKKVKGGMIPMKVKGFQDEKVILDIRFVEVKFLEKVDPETFAKP